MSKNLRPKSGLQSIIGLFFRDSHGRLFRLSSLIYSVRLVIFLEGPLEVELILTYFVVVE